MMSYGKFYSTCQSYKNKKPQRIGSIPPSNENHLIPQAPTKSPNGIPARAMKAPSSIMLKHTKYANSLTPIPKQHQKPNYLLTHTHRTA